MNDDESALQEAKDAMKRALVTGDTAALRAAEREIIRVRGLKTPDEQTFLHDSGNLVAWGEAQGPVRA